jgi:hypothetical protein
LVHVRHGRLPSRLQVEVIHARCSATRCQVSRCANASRPALCVSSFSQQDIPSIIHSLTCPSSMINSFSNIVACHSIPGMAN